MPRPGRCPSWCGSGKMEEKRLIVTFGTTAGAMAMEKACREEGVPGRLIPIPRSITAGCGMCYMAPPDARPAVEELMIRRRLQTEGLYELLLRR